MGYSNRDVRARMVRAVLLCCVLLSAGACSTQKKLQRIRAEKAGVVLNRIDDAVEAPTIEVPQAKEIREEVADGEPIIMDAILDEESGEMVATEELAASMVVSRRYQVAERNGKVDLPFEILVPEKMMASPWQLRINPVLVLEGKSYSDTSSLEPVFVTGYGYRERQYRGYEQYDKFLSGIITDSTRLVYKHQLDQFIKRNLPELYAYKTDSSFVSDSQFASAYNVTAREAIDHYTKGWIVSRNERIENSKDEKFRKFVKAPILSDGVRLDTVLVNPNGDYVYRYIQTIDTRKDLKYAYIHLDGSIYRQDKELYMMPKTDSIEYPISSLSHFVKDITRYKMKIVWRHQEANSSYDIKFAQGKSKIDRSLGNNAAELDRIASNLRALLQNEEFDLDSIIVNASCSPEGSIRVNNRIARERSASVCNYFDGFMASYIDSLVAAKGFSVDIDGNVVKEDVPKAVPFISKYTGEDWDALDRIVSQSDSLSQENKDKYFEVADKYESKPDQREAVLRKEPFFAYMSESLYPELRKVRFNFNLHRKGMVEEFVQTEEVDTAYARGVNLLRDRDYDGALEILYDYDDYNAAVACMAKDRNLRALECLEHEENTADVCYLKAILYSRFGEDEKACEWYRKACELDRIYVFRGNLDPEITVLIQKYGLNKN